MKLSKWAELQGITYQAAWKQFKAGKITGAYQLETGTIIVPKQVSTPKVERNVVYVRVSSSGQKEDLKRQENRLLTFCAARGWIVHQVIREIASGLNDKRPKLEKILLDERVTRIIVEHKDRFARFGTHYIEILLQMQGRELVIINEATEDKEDLMQDFVSIITSFVARIYGQRRSKRKKVAILKVLKEDEDK